MIIRKHISLESNELCYCGFVERGKLSIMEKLLNALEISYYIPIRDNSLSSLAKELFYNEDASMPFVRMVFVIATPTKIQQLITKQFPACFSCNANGEAIVTMSENMFHSFYHFLHMPLQKTEHEIIIEQGEPGENLLTKLSPTIVCSGTLNGCEGLYWEGENYQGKWMCGIGFPLTPNCLLVISCRACDLQEINRTAYSIN